MISDYQYKNLNHKHYIFCLRGKNIRASVIGSAARGIEVVYRIESVRRDAVVVVLTVVSKV